jgi:hypothetical protein
MAKSKTKRRVRVYRFDEGAGGTFEYEEVRELRIDTLDVWERLDASTRLVRVETEVVELTAGFYVVEKYEGHDAIFVPAGDRR